MRKILAATLAVWLLGAVVYAASYVIDTMTGTTGQTILVHTPDTGGSYVNHAVCFSAMQITDHNDLGHTTPTSGCTVYNNTSPGSAEYSVEADLVFHSGSIADYSIGVVGRAVNGAETYYAAAYDGFNSEWALYRANAGSFTGMGTFSQSLSSGNTYNVRLEMTNSNKKLFVNDVERISNGDNSIAGTGFGGITSYRESNPDALHIDNFRVEDNPGGGGGATCTALLLLKVGC